MYPFLKNTHALLAIFVFIFLLIAVFNALAGYSKRKAFTGSDRRIGLFALIFTHLQFVVGLILYFQSPLGKAAFGQMKDAALRLTSLEHPLVNLIAVVLITIGWSKHKRIEDSTKKFSTFLIFYGLGLVLLLSRVPWDLFTAALKDLASA